jgi:AcrR family transcriptional regulator
MPAKVDADDRRRRLVLAAAELIADEGINALTNARIAKRLSGSTTMVTHYFRSKRELVLDTYQTMASRSRARVEQAMRESDDPLASCLHALLPLEESTRLEWKVWLAYQGMSVGDPELTQIWASRAASAVDRISRLIEADISAGHISSSIDPDMESGRLFSLIQGMSFQSIVDPKHWSPAHLRRIVDLELLRLRGVDGRPHAEPGAELADCIIRASGPAAKLIGELLASLLYNNCRTKREPAVNRSGRERTPAAPRGPVWSLPCTGENVLSRPVPRVWCPLGHRGAEFVVGGPCGRSFEAACCRFAAVSATEVAQ